MELDGFTIGMLVLIFMILSLSIGVYLWFFKFGGKELVEGN
jgi:hypothetical protein